MSEDLELEAYKKEVADKYCIDYDYGEDDEMMDIAFFDRTANKSLYTFSENLEGKNNYYFIMYDNRKPCPKCAKINLFAPEYMNIENSNWELGKEEIDWMMNALMVTVPTGYNVWDNMLALLAIEPGTLPIPNYYELKHVEQNTILDPKVSEYAKRHLATIHGI